MKRTSPTNPTGEGVNQRDREGDLAKRWRSRLISLTKGHASAFPFLAEALRGDNVEMACHDLFGVIRHSTLAGMCKILEQMIALRGDIIPWTTAKVMDLFEAMRGTDAGPDTPLRYHYVLKKLGKLLGNLDDLTSEVLIRKRDAIRDTLCKEIVRTDRRAVAPTRKMAAALERATEAAPTEPLRWLASAFRFALGASARMSDCQHAAPKEFLLTESTAELRAWQTKVSGLIGNRRPMPLIAPLHTFSGIYWWLVFQKGIKDMDRDTFLSTRDFLVPELGEGATSFKRSPMQNQQMLRHLRRLAAVGGQKKKKPVASRSPASVYSWQSRHTRRASRATSGGTSDAGRMSPWQTRTHGTTARSSEKYGTKSWGRRKA